MQKNNERYFLFKMLAALFLAQYTIYLLVFAGCVFGPFAAGTASKGLNVCPDYTKNMQAIFEFAVQTVLALLAGKSLAS